MDAPIILLLRTGHVIPSKNVGLDKHAACQGCV